MDKNVLDVEDFMERVQGDRDLLLELLEIYQQDYTGKRKALGEAVAQKNAEEIKNTAHALKGASGNISAKKMHATCLHIEQKAKDNSFDGLEALLAQLDQEYLELKTNMTELKANP
jgi:hypothetical protein